MRTIIIGVTVLIMLLACGCSRKEQPQEDPVVHNLTNNPEAPLPDNYIRPDEPSWLPTFSTPEGWEQSPSYPGFLRSTSTKFSSSFINIEKQPDQADPRQLRDDLFEHQFCGSAEESSKYNAFSDCQRGFQKSTENMEGHKLHMLKYFGSWRSKTDEVVEVFFQHGRFTVGISVEGDYAASEPALRTVLSTLDFKWEKLNRGINEQELGGL